MDAAPIPAALPQELGSQIPPITQFALSALSIVVTVSHWPSRAHWAVEGAEMAVSVSNQHAERLSQMPVHVFGWIPTVKSGSFPSLNRLSDISRQQALARRQLNRGHRREEQTALLWSVALVILLL